MPTSADKGCHVVSTTITPAINLSFLDWSRYRDSPLLQGLRSQIFPDALTPQPALRLPSYHICYAIFNKQTKTQQAIIDIGSASFKYDMRRLTEILAFPKAWYRRSIVRRLFLGDLTTTATYSEEEESSPSSLEGDILSTHLSLGRNIDNKAKLICYKEEDLNKQCQQLFKVFTAQGYPKHLGNSQINRALSNQEPIKKQPSNDILLTTHYYEGLDKLRFTLNTGYNILTSSLFSQNLLNNDPRITTQMPPNLRNILVHPKLPDPATHNNKQHWAKAFYPCNKPRCMCDMLMAKVYLAQLQLQKEALSYLQESGCGLAWKMIFLVMPGSELSEVVVILGYCPSHESQPCGRIENDCHP
ncbi:unnamed protein product [Timema podura]|uniref:Bridge-like lipid transfer protein family member 1 C-terminal domain-containing protein n=1 Tax=Timema podura TaxID=61482 RepID=A0ABN7NBW0_TIMPD|nr:unnamed protein product [Timema podura]